MFRVHRLGTRFGVHVLPVHYYSSLPDVVVLERTRDVWAKKSSLPGIGANLGRQAETLRLICKPYQSEYAGNAAFRHATEHAFGPGYGYIEAQALHGVVRHFKPERVVEVGSGVSTWCMLQALEKNREETGRSASITCIEPFPSERLRSLEGVRLDARGVQTVPFEEGFAELGENDFLFIDSSHTVKPGSDVNYLVLEILPRMRAGVIVHFHDIFLPFDYSPAVLQTFTHWSETSLLRAFLTHNPRAEVLFCQSQLHHESPEALAEVFPEYRPEPHESGLRPAGSKPFERNPDRHFPSSIYLRLN